MKDEDSWSLTRMIRRWMCFLFDWHEVANAKACQERGHCDDCGFWVKRKSVADSWKRVSR